VLHVPAIPFDWIALIVFSEQKAACYEDHYVSPPQLHIAFFLLGPSILFRALLSQFTFPSW
jgi:hypothetical protein